MPKTVADLLSMLDEPERKMIGEGEPAYTPPMTARLARTIFSDDDWLFERKLDGVRCLAVRKGECVHLYSRSEQLLDDNFPEIMEALKRLPEDSVVDGEVVAFDKKQTRFELLQPYLYPSSQSPVVDEFGRVPVESANDSEKRAQCWFYLFDVLQLGQCDLRSLPLVTRKRILRSAIRFSKPLQFTNHRKGEGERLFEVACQKGWEGVIAKRASSTYRSTRSRDWLKFKCNQQQELVIGGYTDGYGLHRELGALLMGFFEGGRLRYAGKVGTGFDLRTLGRLKRTLDQHRQRQSPFSDQVDEKNCHWLAPELVCEVGFTAWTRDRKLCHPRYLGLRDDKDAREVTRETPEEAA